MKFYIVRDSMGGELVDYVSVWTEKPKRHRMGRAIQWASEKRDRGGYVESYWLSDCIKKFGTYPDSDLMMIVVERSCL